MLLFSKLKRRNVFLVAAVVLALAVGVTESPAAGWRGTPPPAAKRLALFKFVKALQVTPDAMFQTGSFARINYIPATNRFVMTFGVKNKSSSGECQEAGYAYKEFKQSLKPTGGAGFFLSVAGGCDANDSGSLMVDNDYYFAWVPSDEPLFYGWEVLKFDATTWNLNATELIPLVYPHEKSNDPMVSWANGWIDVSGQYDEYGPPPPLDVGAATHHTFITPDLQVVDKFVLEDTPHVCGSSMIYVNGLYYMVTADAFIGDLIVMTYDSEWHFLGFKKLRNQAHWSQGIAYDGQRFYVAYLDTRQRNSPEVFPIILNVHLAAFDKDWELVDDVAVTDFTRSDNMLAGRPWVIHHKHKLYVSYDVDTIDPVTNLEDHQWQAFVSVYRLIPPRPDD